MKRRSPMQSVRHWRRQGAIAMLGHILQGQPEPANPFPRSDRRRLYFDWGVESVARLQLGEPA